MDRKKKEKERKEIQKMLGESREQFDKTLYDSVKKIVITSRFCSSAIPTFMPNPKFVTEVEFSLLQVSTFHQI